MTPTPTSPRFSPRHLLHWRTARWALAAAVLPTLWACNEHPLQAPNPAPMIVNEQYREVNPVRQVDILVMVDNSLSMEQEQVNLAKNFPVFISELRKIPGGLPDVQIAVVSSDVGAAGVPVGSCRDYGDGARFQTQDFTGTKSCGLNGDAKYIVANNGGKDTNLAPGKRLEDVFACMALRGTAGCGFEHQLQAVRVALIPQPSINPGNQGFLNLTMRREAYLAIIIVTDEDDCSAPPDAVNYGPFFQPEIKGQEFSFRCNTDSHQCGGKQVTADVTINSPVGDCKPVDKPKVLIPVSDFVQDIKNLKPNRTDKIVVAAITGVPRTGEEATARYQVVKNPANQNITIAPVCSTATNGSADPALRIKQFVEAFGKNGSLHSICNDDFSPALKAIGEKVATKLVDKCIATPLVDKIPSTPALDPDCLILDQVPQGNDFVDVPIPQCNATKSVKPCWAVEPDMSAMDDPRRCVNSGYTVDVARAEGVMSPPGTKLAIKCLTCNIPDGMRCKRG